MPWLNLKELNKQKERVVQEINQRKDPNKRKSVFNSNFFAFIILSFQTSPVVAGPTVGIRVDCLGRVKPFRRWLSKLGDLRCRPCWV